MEGVQVTLAGVVLGMAGALPPAVLFELALRKERHVSVAAGIASIFASFTMLVVAMLVVWSVARASVLPFGVAEAASFLLVWAVEAWRAWRSAQRDVPGRKEEW